MSAVRTDDGRAPGTFNVLALTDHFVTKESVGAALRSVVGRSTLRHRLDVIENEWPLVPTQQSNEVNEFVGSQDEVTARVKDREVILTHVGPITERVLNAAKHLRVIGVFRGGPVNVNVEAATQRGIPVLNAPGRNGTAVAEFTIGLILAVLRRIAEASRDLSDGRWRGDLYTYENAGSELNGQIAGVVGLGSVGMRVVHLLRAFGMHVLVYDPYVPPESIVASGGEPSGLDNLLETSNVVSLHARLTQDTREMVGRSFLKKMKSDAVLINTARGALVDYNALGEALERGEIAGAGIDVFEEEPVPPESRLLRLHNVVATPHIAGSSKETARRGVASVVADVVAVLAGRTPKNCVNPSVLR